MAHSGWAFRPPGATLNLYQGAIPDGRQTAVVVADPNTTVHMEDILVARTVAAERDARRGYRPAPSRPRRRHRETRDEGLLMRLGHPGHGLARRRRHHTAY